ncbi:DUF4194 domain-containing protein [Kushneria aurantia]|uniref:DUF4194 domain-containing protein n=1 Tax=Kushneria aurantia TaxID=504092 RepID=A0ABV6G4Q6_9GAMM|nr:DUF4194 domain-containing protein [Kushneria aurantia]
MSDSQTDTPSDLSPLLIHLLKGVLYRDQQETLWQALMTLQGRVRDYVAVLGLELALDETEGYAYLRQVTGGEEDSGVPRLVPRRQLSYPVSLLLALLRKKLAEHDASGEHPRLILTQQQIVELVRLFLPDTANEAKLVDRVQGDINKVIELGFLRRLRGQHDRYEVRRILQSFVDAQWLGEFEQRLQEYREHADAK